MEVDNSTIKDRAQKRIVDEIGNVETKDVQTSKKPKSQEIEEEEIETRLVETKPDQQGF